MEVMVDEEVTLLFVVMLTYGLCIPINLKGILELNMVSMEVRVEAQEPMEQMCTWMCH
jgi:hypothetical protein